MSDSSRPHGLQPTRLLRPWDFPGKSTGVECHCLLCSIDLVSANLKNSSVIPCFPSNCIELGSVAPSQVILIGLRFRHDCLPWLLSL